MNDLQTIRREAKATIHRSLISSLLNVSSDTPLDGDVLVFDEESGNWRPDTAVGGFNLGDLDDVSLGTGSNDGDILINRGTAGWVDEPLDASIVTYGAHDSVEEGLDELFSFFNGTIHESFDAVITSDGVTITMSLEQTDGGDLTLIFDDGHTTLVTTPPLTIELTAGSDTSPQVNYIFIPASTKVLTKSTSGWPADEHIKISFFFVQSAAFVQSMGALIIQNWNDHSHGINLQGHMSHVGERLRASRAVYKSGLALTVTITSNGGAPDNVQLAFTSGVAYQVHSHVLSAKDMAAGDVAHVVNDSVTPYDDVTDLNGLLTDSTGGSMSNTRAVMLRDDASHRVAMSLNLTLSGSFGKGYWAYSTGEDLAPANGEVFYGGWTYWAELDAD